MKNLFVLACFVLMGSAVMAQTTDGTKSNPHKVTVEKVNLTQDIQPVSTETESKMSDEAASSVSDTPAPKSAKTGKAHCAPKGGSGCCAKKDGMSKKECKKKCSEKDRKKACKGHGSGAL